jgi:hypothetical protein
MPKKKTKKSTAKKVIKKSLIKRIDDTKVDPAQLNPLDKVKTEIVINNGVVIVNPIFNPFDENNKN